ncbi:glycosyltransferase [Lederbergia lenta]|uniref:glycosyltransferase n=1 Tax=Lederbergia lenta TaxID=1467 RepID=UPI00203DF135|nr:glycosyltransferase [Lederbergia lenta]MCM3111981.1 glycosyltransferase [Lederbergia lenta]
MTKKVLIITYSFPPLNNIAARRFGDLSKHLYNNDWEPYILTTMNTGPLDVFIPEENIYRIGKHPQVTSEIRKNGNSIRKESYAMRLKRKAGFNSRLIDRTYLNWYKLITKMDLEILKQKKFDIIIASFGPGAALFAGSFLSKNLNIPWIADFRDLGSLYKDHSLKKNFLFKALDIVIERQLLKSASAVTTVSEGLKGEITDFYRLPTYVIYNGWERSQSISKEKIEIEDEPYIYYAGRFYQHQLESIYLLLRSLKSHNFNLRIRSLGPNHLNENVIAYAKEIGINNRIQLLSPATPEIVESESSNSIINLVVEDLDKSFKWKKGTLTGKLLSLLIKPAPILAIARDDSEIGDVLRETSKGVLCSTVEEVNEFLLKINTYRATANSENQIMFYSKERQARELASVLKKYI